MSEYADSHSKASRKARVDRMLGADPMAPVDASGYKPPGPLDAEKKTGPCQPKRTAYAKGGKVEGEKAHSNAGRKARDAGGPTAIQQLRPQVPTSGLYGSGFAPTHSGMLAQGAGLKKGGMARRHKRADGGQTGYGEEDWARSDRAPSRPSPGTSSTSDAYWNRSLQGVDAIGHKQDQDSAQSRKSGGLTKRSCGGKAGERRLEMAKEARKARAEGGRTKGKTNINIIIGSPKDQQPMVPPPPSAMPPAPPPPRPGLPPAAMGAMSGPPGAMGAPGGAPPGMPPQMPPMGRG